MLVIFVTSSEGTTRLGGLWVVGAVAGLGILALAAQSCSRAAPDTGTRATMGGTDGELSLRKLVIVGDDGSERAVLESMAEGGARLVFRSEDKAVAATIGVDPGGPRITLGSADGRPIAELGLGKSGDTALILRDRNGRRRAGIIVAASGASGVALFDGDEQPRCKLDLKRDGTSCLMLGDKTGMTRVMAGAAEGGACTVALYGKDGPRVSMELDAAEKGGFRLLGSDGEDTWSRTGP